MKTVSHAPPFQPALKLLKGNAADQIYELVREQILTGKYRRGAKLPTEKAFSAMYGVSGVTIRSAMRSLAAAGLIEVKQGSGSYVTAHSDQLLAGSLRSMIQVNSTTPTEILTTLGGMNAFAAELAAPIITESDLDCMQIALNDISTRQTVDEISDGLKRFLHLLADASGNALLAAFCKYLSALQISLAWEISDGTLKGWQQVTGTRAKDRQNILDRLRARDAEGARLAALTYHRSTCQFIASLSPERQEKLNASVASILSALVTSPTPPAQVDLRK